MAPTSFRISRPLQGLVVVAALVAVLQIPVQMIRGLIGERAATRAEAEEEVGSIWGGAQTVTGPRLAIPYDVRSATGQVVGTAVASFLPDRLSIEGDVASERLARGLFTVPVYDAALVLHATFGPIDSRAIGVAPEAMRWEEAVVVVETTHLRSLATARLIHAGTEAPFESGGVGSRGGPGIYAPVSGMVSEGGDVQVALELKGSRALGFTPHGGETRVALRSDWPSPSFDGAWLPEERAVADGGFTAVWRVSSLVRGYPQAWRDVDAPEGTVEGARFGVTLHPDVDPYRMAERSTKYAPLFLVLTFGLLWSFDVLMGIRVHPVQYALVGMAMCQFYLLELSLAEHLGFLPAYIIAAASVVLLIGGYSAAVLRATARGVFVAGGLSGLYAYLLTLLTLEEYALLAGSVGAFVLLTTVMWLTRWIDWSAPGASGTRTEPARG